MSNQSFSLQPFPPTNYGWVSNPLLRHLKITGNITRYCNTLAICYVLLGHLAELVIPPPADMPACKSGLWEATCFEFFLAVKNSPGYWEFNLSPAGHWAVYRFAAYRQEMQKEMAFTSLPFSVQDKHGGLPVQPDSLSLTLELDLDKIVQEDQVLEVAISAVIKHRNGELTYWALTHPGPQADFHRRDSFIVEL